MRIETGTKNHNSKPIISVVMAAYNEERLIREAVDSILNQSFGDLEFIIVNDCSTDKTPEILSEYNDSRIVLVNNEANIGLAKSLNIGIGHAKGELIARMDADDVSLPERLKLQYEYMESHPDVDILGGQAWQIDENGQHIGEKTKPISAEDISRCIEYVCPLIHPTYCVRKRVFEILHGYRDLATAQDYDFLLRAFEYGIRIENLPVKLIKYRLSPYGISYGNPLRGMVFARYILKMHKGRVRGRESDERIISFLKEYKKHSGHWFSFCYNTRNHFLRRSRNGNIFTRYLYLSLVFLASIMHYELFLSTLRSYRSLGW